MTGGIELRMGRWADVPAIAGLMRAAGGGLFEQMLDEAVPGVGVGALLALAAADPEGAYRFGNAVVAERDGDCCGLSLAYDSAEHGLPRLVQAIIPAPRLAPVRALVQADVPRSFYILALAVAPDFTRKGLGRLLVQATARLAAARGFDRVSLHVWLGNEPAVRLYRAMGFVIDRELSVQRTPHMRWRGPVALCIADTATLLSPHNG